MGRAVPPDVLDRTLDAVHHPRRDDRVEIFRVPVVLGRRPDARVRLPDDLVAAHLATGSEERLDHRRDVSRGRGRVEQHGLGSTTDTGAAELGVEHDLARHVHVGRSVHVDVAIALQVTDHRHARLLLDACDEVLASARHDDVDVVGHALEHVADGLAVLRRDQLDARQRQARRTQAFLEAGVDGPARCRALRAAAKDHRIGGLEAQRPGVRRHVRPALVDDADHAERHADPLDAQPVRPLPLGQDAPDGIRQGRDLLQARRHRLQAARVEAQPVEQRAADAPRLRRSHVGRIGLENRGRSQADGAGRGLERGVACSCRRLREHAGGLGRGPAHVLHHRADASRVRHPPASPAREARIRTRSSRWTSSSRPR